MGVFKLLPFTIPSGDRQIALSRRIELATIFCLVEISRDKGGGLISRKPPEEILFVTEVGYPFWLVPWGKKTLLFDGLGIISHTQSFDILPDAGVFIHEVKGSLNKLEAYSAFLSYNIDYFKEVSGKGKKIIKGLIIDPSFNEDFFSLLPKAKRSGNVSNKLLLSPLLVESAIKASLEELISLRDALKEDVKNLRNIVKKLIVTTKKHINTINKKIKETNRRREAEIAVLKSNIMKKIEELRRECDQKIVEVSEETSRQIQDLSQDLVKFEVDKKQLTAYAERCEAEISTARTRKDEGEEVRWKQELEKCRRDLLEVDKKLEEINKDIENARSTRDLETSRLNSDYASQVENIMADLKKVEVARDTEIQMYQQTLTSLEKSTSAIISHINKLIELRNLELSEVKKSGYPITKRKYTLVYLPFFLACYKQGLKKRYVVFPPSIANAMNGVKKIKTALRPFGVRIMLQEVSMSITNLLNKFVNLIEQNSMFEDRIVNACNKTNILKAKNILEDIKAGLEELAKEGWLSKEELKLFNEYLENNEY